MSPIEQLKAKIAAEGVEATAFPFFGIIDGRRLPDLVWIAGPWFSREAAKGHLRRKSHRYPPSAIVYCFSGHMSGDWRAVLAAE